jgi:NAD(P)-dependent dehydrogenase (short-subunit alcohol dehydrogenase family)
MVPGPAADKPKDIAAIVTGASRGIGRAVALALAGHGARVLAISRTVSGERDDRITEVALDLAAPGSVASVVAAADRAFGRAPDVLVNNAGAFFVAPIVDTSPESFDRLLALNLSVPFRLVHAFVGPMRARGSGHIVTVGSIADHVAFPENGAYSASKFGLRGLHEVLRAEVGGSGVRATLISPSAVDTSLWDTLAPATRASFPAPEAMLAASDVADAVLYSITRPPRVSVDEIRLASS